MKNFIKKYCDLGWRIFPALIYENTDGTITKQPAINDWQLLATNEPDKAEALFIGNYNCIGVATGRTSGISVIDIDVKGDENGFLALESAGIKFPTTPIQSTPSGGKHLFFSYTERVKTSVKTLPGVDIRNDGGFIVLTPSTYPDGRKYEWNLQEEPWSLPLGQIPDMFLTLFPVGKKPSELPLLVKKGERNATLFKFACAFRDKGLTREELLSQIKVLNQNRCSPPVSDEELFIIAESAAKYEPSAPKGGKRKPLVHLINTIKSDKSLIDLFAYNEFTCDVEYMKSPPWDPLMTPGKILTDRDIVFLKVYLSENTAIEPNIKMLEEAICHISFSHKHHPVRDYIRTLTWDGTQRLETWLIKYAGAEESKYVREISRKVLTAAVARVFDPGCMYQQMLVLEGVQDIGKSRLVRALSDPWFTEVNITANTKDVVDIMRGRWILEVSEMICVSQVDIAHLKQFISCQSDRCRLAYRRNTEDFPRQSIFIGTKNPVGENTWLRDEENRRFWPVSVYGEIDIDGLKSVRDQLFAEAYVTFKKGESLWLDDKDAKRIAKEAQFARQEIDPWTGFITEWISQGNYEFDIPTLAMSALGMDRFKIDRGVQTRIGIILKRLKVLSKRIGHEQKKVYCVEEIRREATESALPPSDWQ